MTVPATEQVLTFTEQHIISRLDSVAQHLGVAGAYTWEQLVRLTVVEGAFGIFLFVLSIVFLTLCSVVTHKLYKYAEADDWDHESKVMPFVVSALITVVALILFGRALYFRQEAILKVAVPEAYLLREILQFAGSKAGL